jgi:hypothetical protein
MRPVFVIEEWGDEGDDVRPFLANPSAVTIGDENQIYVLDAGNHRIVLFSTEGRFLRTIGRAGQGPGEFSLGTNYAAMDMAIFGDRLFVNDPLQRRVHVFNGEGILEHSIALAEGTGSISAWDNSFYASTSGVHDSDSMQIVEFDLKGGRISRFGPAYFGTDPHLPSFANAHKIAVGDAKLMQAYSYWPLLRLYVNGKPAMELFLDTAWWALPPLRETIPAVRREFDAALGGNRAPSWPERPFFEDIEYISAGDKWAILSNFSTVHIVLSDGTLVRSIVLGSEPGGEGFHINNIGVDRAGHLLCGSDPIGRSAIACYLIE